MSLSIAPVFDELESSDDDDDDDLPSIPSVDNEADDGESGASSETPEEEKVIPFGEQRGAAAGDEVASALQSWKKRPEPKQERDLSEKRYPCWDLRFFCGFCIVYPPQDAVVLGDIDLVIKSVKSLKTRFPHDWRARLNQRHEGYGGHTLTSLAILESNYEIAEWLIDNGVDIDQRDRDTGLAPLHHAVRRECLADTFAGVVRSLLEAGAEVDIRDKKGVTPLMIAALFGNVEQVKVLVENGADIEGRDKLGWRPLNFAASGGRREAAKHLVVTEGVDLNFTDKQRETAERLSMYMHTFEGRRMRHGAVVSFLEAYQPSMAT